MVPKHEMERNRNGTKPNNRWIDTLGTLCSLNGEMLLEFFAPCRLEMGNTNQKLKILKTLDVPFLIAGPPLAAQVFLLRLPFGQYGPVNIKCLVRNILGH